MRAQLEIELDFDWGTRSRSHEADGLTISTNRWVPVQRPGDRLENRGFAGAVGSDDSGQTRSELDLRLRVLTEVGELDAIQSQAAPSTSSAGPATRSAS